MLSLFCWFRTLGQNFSEARSVNILFPGNNVETQEAFGMRLTSKKRIFLILIGFTMILILFVLRIGWMAWSSAARPVTAGGRTINELAVRQREEGVELDSGRGHFIDREGERLTGSVRWLPTLFPVRDLPEPESLSKLASIIGVPVEELEIKWKTLQAPFTWNYNTPAKEQTWPRIEGVEWLPYMKRYSEGVRGNQWLGYVAQRPDVLRHLNDQGRSHLFPISMQVGASGLELTMDRFLRGIGGTRVSYALDGQHRSLSEIGTRIKSNNNPYYPVQIQTTTRESTQRKLEELVDAMDMREGAIVVLDARQGDIISMVSRPFYDPGRINLSGGEWSNRAVKAEVPGSIFKLVIAAAALESGASHPEEVFNCTGHYGRYGLSCWKTGGHGKITLKEGFAQSCNTVFAELGERLSAAQISSMANNLGLSRKVGWYAESFIDGQSLRQIDQEEKGTVFQSGVQIDGGVLAQTALGQRDVLVTPLQAANMVVSLLHDGRLLAPRLVNRIQYKDGSVLAQFPVQALDQEARISPKTAREVLSWMRLVVTEGTGRSLASAAWPLAGKSGTAQTMKSGKRLNQQWFIGYGPVQEPRYAVAVLVQNRPAGSKHQATAVFRRVMDILADEEGI